MAKQKSAKPKRAKKSRKAIIPLRKKTLHNGALKVILRVLDVPRDDGTLMEGVKREIVRRRDAAAALVHDVERDAVLLAEVFRAPVYDCGGAGWLREIVAGVVEKGEAPEDCIRRELMEEVGIRAETLTPIAAVFASPGYTTERLHIFYAPIRADDLIDESARGVDAGEDVARVWIPLAEFLDALPACADAKTLIAGQWLAAQRGAGKNDA
ncbi:MAG: NUDIX domain-containing protein [Alphaproteobacteria bacterium]|nr:NUDIX domain-containing protein [Alphaproteobacteria bacterium]